MKLAFVLLALIACGDNKKPSKKDDAAAEPIAHDAPIDSPPLVACVPTHGMTMSVRLIGRVSGGATLATSPPNDGRLFVLEQQGRIRIFENEQLRPEPFIDLTSKVTAGGEQGLLGLAFDPSYARNGYFYVFYTKGACTTASPCTNVLERYQVSATDLNVADPSSGTVLLSIPDFAVNHNAGMIEFGPDHYLYISTGDGGLGGDPHRNAQATDRTAASCISTQCEPLLGKILRIDPNHPSGGKPYGIPLGNPFASGGGEPEIYITGLRNPWRWSFDRITGDMWIADVGQALYEELDYLPWKQQSGVNLGWSVFEGPIWYTAHNYPNDPTGKTFPTLSKSHVYDRWSAIIGGEVYRGPCYPDVNGYYFFTDNGSQNALNRYVLGGTPEALPAPTGGWPGSPASIHGDARGELYEVTTQGLVYHIEAGPP